MSSAQKYLHAEVAQLAEHDLAKVGVAGSNPVFRSSNATDKALAYEPEPISGRRNPLYHEGIRQQDGGTRVVA